MLAVDVQRGHELGSDAETCSEIPGRSEGTPSLRDHGGKGFPPIALGRTQGRRSRTSVEH